MSTARRLSRISVEDYLAGELIAPVKHEYLDGVVRAMAGARNAHNVIAGNAFGALYVRLRGRRCRPFNSDVKVRIRMGPEIRFYYPDVSVACRPNPQDDSFQDEPDVIFEVLSRSTRHVDEGEKKDAYLTIPSLRTYVLVEQEISKAIVFRRTERGVVREELAELDAVLRLPEIQLELPLAEVYETVKFTPEPDDDEASDSNP